MKNQIDVCGTEIYNDDATGETYVSLRGVKLTPEVLADLLLIRYELIEWAKSGNRDPAVLADKLLAALARKIISGTHNN